MSLDKLLTTAEAARLLEVSESYLNKLRMRPGDGPPHIRIGSNVRYRPADLAAWVDGQKRASTRDVGAATGQTADAEVRT